jgi:hypothetical protein
MKKYKRQKQRGENSKPLNRERKQKKTMFPLKKERALVKKM